MKRTICKHKTVVTIFSAFLIAASVMLLSVSDAKATDGHFLHGVGTINQTMGGAGTAVFLDSLGTIAWNPAGSVDFEGGRLDLTMEYFIPDRTLSSSISGVMSGSTDSETNASIMPSFGYIYHRKGTTSAWHFSMYGLAGFGVDYPQDNTAAATTNAILTPQASGGFGAIESDYRLMKFAAGKSYIVSKRLALGYSVIPAYSSLKVTPAPFANPTATGYPSASKSEGATGIGFQGGLRYKASDKINLGLSISTPLHFSKFKWNDSNGNPLYFNLDVPGFVTMGIGYKPCDKTTYAADIRWINYADTNGFDKSGFTPTASVAGFGWDNIFTIGIGVQRKITQNTKLRFGYNYSQNPIDSSLSFFNVPAPAIIKDHAAIGLTRTLKSGNEYSIGYYHAFANEISGPMINPATGVVAGTTVTSRLAEDSIALGYAYNF
jgi:long-chain fatty acid transport protein